MKRNAYVAGHFYPSDEFQLIKELKRLLTQPVESIIRSIAVIAPHAGYVYSGEVAGSVYSSVSIPDRLVLMGPSHHHIEAHFGLMGQGSWSTPLGDVPIDTALAARILGKSDLISDDSQAHAGEHSLEVQLPFLRYLNPDIAIVPITHTYYASYSDLEELGHAVAAAILEEAAEVLIVVSTDMSHQVSQETAKRKDFMAIEQIKALDPKGLFDVVQREQISMCGFQAVTSALVAAKDLGAECAELIRYQTSGDVTGDTSSVVGYAGVRIS